MQAESGLADITGSPHAPGRVGVSLVDLATGMFAYEAVLEALLIRGQTGQGEQIDVALFDAVSEWMTVPYLLERYGKAAPQRIGLAHPGICPYGVFTSQDAVDFVLSIQNEGEWQRLCRVGLQQAELLTDPRCVDNQTRVVHRDFVDAVVAKVFADLEYAQIQLRLDAADLAFAPVNQVHQLKHHSDFRTEAIEVSGQSVELPVVPGRLRSTGEVEPASVPRLGEHTQAVKRWLSGEYDEDC